jgi:hypothetical protein
VTGIEADIVVCPSTIDDPPTCERLKAHGGLPCDIVPETTHGEVPCKTVIFGLEEEISAVASFEVMRKRMRRKSFIAESLPQRL